MKKAILLTLVLAFASCANPTATPEAVEGVGFFKPMPEEKFIAGSDDITDFWMKYIEAHNNRDIESIKAMSADSIYVLGPDGSELFTNVQQAELLEVWFEAADPKWDTYWAMPYKAVPSGAEWIIAGHQVTETVEGEESVSLQMIDGEIKDNKVVRFFVYAAQTPAE